MVDRAIAIDEPVFSAVATDEEGDDLVTVADDFVFGVTVTSIQQHAVTVSDSEE